MVFSQSEISMLILKVDHNLAGLQGYLKGLADKQLPFAMARALTRTAQAGQAATVKELEQRFDRPTRTTLKSLRVKPATKTDLSAMVFVKDRPLGGKNPRSMAEILGHQFAGGDRIAKAMEVVLRNGGFLAGDEFVVPGASAKLDRYGNMSRGQIQQVLSQVGIKRAGSTSAASGSARSRRSVAAAGEIFWSMGPGSFGPGAFTRRNQFDYSTGEFKGRRQHLPKGAWMRDGRTVKPILLVVRAPRYARRIDMPRVIQQVIDTRFNEIFDQSYSEAQATAR